MRSHVARRLVYAAGVTSLVAVGAAAAAVPTAVAAPDHPAAPATAAAAPAGGVSPVLLITGMRFGFGSGPGGRAEPMMLPGPSGSSARQAVPVTGLRLAGRSFEIPADALPYLGHGLDPGLFDLAALRRLEHNGRLPVRMTYQGHVPVLPGIRITSAAAGTARGYLTSASAPKFGAALRRQFAADHDRASYGTDGLFAHGVSIALAGAAAPRPVKPQFVMHTLTVHGTDLAGKPDNGDVAIVMNADDGARFGDPLETETVFEHGVAKFSVPQGNYWLIGDFIGSHFPSAQRLVIKPQLAVHTNHAQISLDERAASSEVRARTPRPAVLQDGSLTLVRTPGLPRGQSSEFELFTFPGGPLWVSPTRQKPTVGGLKAITQFQLASRFSRHAVPYGYSLDFESTGLIPSEHFRVRPGSLATIDNRYFQDFPSIGGWNVTGGTRPEFGVILLSGSVPIRLPGHLIEYVTARPDVVWSQTYFQFVDVAGGFPGTAGGQSSAFRSFRPGQHLTEDWNAYPLHPQPAVSQARFGEVFFPPIPAAARVGNELTLLPTVFSDNTAGHQGAGYLDGTGFFTSSVPTISGHFRIEQDGKTLASGNPVQSPPQVKLSSRPSTLRFTLTARRSDPHYDLSTASDTTWTWRSRPAPTATVPVHWGCFTKSGNITRKCAVQPMLTLNYQVAGLHLDGATAPGRQVIRLDVGHLQLASNPAITRATMAVSFDGGKTWHDAKITAAGKSGQFTAAFTAPARAFVTLRVTAKDKAGGSILETITSAYKTFPAPTTRPAASGFITPPCARPQPGQAGCFLMYRPQTAVNREQAAGTASRPRGLTPADLRSAYKLPDLATSDQTVAVSIAFHTDGLANFLATYRKEFGIPPCTVASGCFRQVNQQGKAAPAEPSGTFTGWDLEATLDVSMISVACPHCKILVVEAKDNSEQNLAATDATAARMGAQVISNSYGGPEGADQLPLEKDYSQPGHTVVASSGDLGYTSANFPADLANVTAVGGTQLTKAPNSHRGWAEAVWNNSNLGAGGSGCSAWVAKPSWQHDTHCPTRTIADLSAVAANVPIFNSTYGGWITVAGTSVAAPLVAGMYGLAGNGATRTTADLYSRPRSFFDITKGNNAFLVGFTPAQVCGRDYLCTAKTGYDAPTGLGTPDGIGGF